MSPSGPAPSAPSPQSAGEHTGPEPRTSSTATKPAAGLAEPLAGPRRPLDLPAVRRAWRMLLDGGSKVTGGMGVILRAADLAIASDSEITVGFPPGSPAPDRLAEPTRRRAIESSLSEILGRPISLGITTADVDTSDPHGQRITAESARQERLRRLVAEEPLLGAAVREWDLELLD